MFRNIFRIAISSRKLNKNFWNQQNRMTIRTPRTEQKFNSPVLISAASLFSIFNIFKNDVPEESELIMTIKRSILCIQRGEHEKAEQLLHIALRLSQDFQNKEAVTYIYDVMANLAYEVGNFEKAEKLFVNVMQRLLSDGRTDDDPKMLHISSKIAHMAGMQDNLDKAIQGFEWTLQKIEANRKYLEDDDLLELWGLVKNLYAQTLMKSERFHEAKIAFHDALRVYRKYHEEISEETILLLNNLSVACSQLNELEKSEQFLKEAIEITKKMPDLTNEGIYHVNLGMIYIKKGLLEQSKKVCSMAWKIGNKKQDKETMEKADYCLELIKNALNYRNDK